MRTLISIAIGMLAACSPSVESQRSAPTSAEVQLRVQPEEVAAGDSIVLVLSNQSSGIVGYNLCTSQVERRNQGGWRALREDRVCTMELRTLPGGERAEYSLMLPSPLAPGDYRVATNVERMDLGERTRVRSNVFRVTE